MTTESDALDDLDEMSDQFTASSARAWAYSHAEIAAVMLLAAVEIRDLREKLEAAVGYKLAAQEIPKGEWD